MSTLSQRSFSGGEITPSLYARTDISKYITSLRTCRNYQVLKHGGARQRSGTTFIGEVKDSSKAVRLIPFNFSLTDNYVLELGDLYIRFIKNGSYIYESTQVITGITNANPAVVTITSHGYSNGDEVQLDDVVGMSGINDRNFKVANVTANTFELQDLNGVNFDSTSIGTYNSGGTAKRIYEIVSIWGESVLFDLNYVQSADVLTVVHQAGGTRNISRISDTNWTANTGFGVSTESSATSPIPSVSGASGTVAEWVVTGVDSSGRERGAAITVGANSLPTSGSPRTVSWSSSSNAVSYRVYRRDNGVKASISFFGFIGEVVDSGSNSFIDDGVVPDLADQPLDLVNFEESINGSANAVTYYQQRLIYGGIFGGLDELVAASTIGDFENFYRYNDPITASGPVVFNLSGRQINTIRHMLDLNGLVLFTEASEIIAQGDAAGTLTPTDINLRTQSYHGSGKLAPIVVDNTAIFVQGRGSIVRDFVFNESSAGYSGNDLTIFSTHLFEGYTLADWTYQKVTNSTIWAARSDGSLLGMTYLKEHQVLAWHKHDFDGGFVESVTSIPDGTEDSLYLVIRRTIDGNTKRYVEKLTTSQIEEIEDVVRMDSTKTSGAYNTTATTVTLSGGTTWGFDETITLTASAGVFDSSYVGDQIHIVGADGTIVKFTVDGFTSSTVLTGKPNKTVPSSMRNTAFTNWGHATKTIDNLWHLEGKDVSIFCDGFVAASPNNAAYTTKTVSNGQVVLDNHYVKKSVGLPYIADIETLDVDSSQGETARDKQHKVGQVNIFCEESRGLWVGPKPPTDDTVDPLEDLYEIKLRDKEDPDSPVDLKTEVVNVKIKSEWNSNGRVFIRQVDPVPSTILSIMPEGNFTFRG